MRYLFTAIFQRTDDRKSLYRIRKQVTYTVNVFDMIGPVMIGPSSSHTAGAVKIGRMARQLFGEQPQSAQITLYGSFAQTGRGHGTDKAIVAGLLNYSFDDERIRDSFRFAKECGLSVAFQNSELKNTHPNTATILLKKDDKALSLTGASIGGGSIRIRNINGFEVDFSGSYNTLLILHRDTPGAIASVTGLLAQNAVNIANMKMYRTHRGGDAMMIIETDQEISPDLLEQIFGLSIVKQATSAKPV